MKRQVLLGALAALVVLAGVLVAVTAQPPVPANHPVPVTPNDDTAKCDQCHVSQGPPPADQSAFCLACHDFFFAHVTAPDPAHPVDFSWVANDCNQCHNLHVGPNPTHQISTTIRDASFCTSCHVPGSAVAGETNVGDFCARCHNLGTPAGHPVAAEGQRADFCLACHENLTAPGS